MDIETWRWKELVTTAGSVAKARDLIATMQVWRVLRDVYVGAEHPDSPEVRLAALRRVLPPDVAITGRASLWLLGIDALDQEGTIDLALPRGRNLRSKPGFAMHALLADDGELFDLGGLLVVTPAKAVVDVVRAEGLVEGVALGDLALRAGVADLELIEQSVERCARLRGVVEAREMLPHLEPRSESPTESRLRMTLVLGGVPRPRAQVDAYRESGEHVGRADLALDGVVLLYDGFDEHSTKTVFGKDRRQRNDYEELGLVTRVFTSDDYYRKPHRRIVETVRQALDMAKGRTRTARSGPDTLRAPRSRPPVTRAQLGQADAA
jgi:hypothetical protein